jgi:hypothetical protein
MKQEEESPDNEAEPSLRLSLALRGSIRSILVGFRTPQGAAVTTMIPPETKLFTLSERKT